MGTLGSAVAPEPCTAVHLEERRACAFVLLNRWPTAAEMGWPPPVHELLVRVALLATQTVSPAGSFGSNAMLLGCTQAPETESG